MGDRSKVILEKSRTVRRRYQRRKQQVVFSKAELERLERAEERDRRAKKLQEKEKRRIANKKKRLEKEALEREERKKSGLPDPNAKVSASQQLLSNFFGKKGEIPGGKKEGGSDGVREKSESLAPTTEEEGDTESDSDSGSESDRDTGPEVGPDRAETEEVDSDDSFDDDDTLTLFNDENVLKELDGPGDLRECLGKHSTKKSPGVTADPGPISYGNTPQPQEQPEQDSGPNMEEPEDGSKSSSSDISKEKEKTPSMVSTKRNSKTSTDIAEGGPSNLDSANVSTKAQLAGETMEPPQEVPTVLYQNAEDVLAGLSSQDLADYDDDEDKDHPRPHKGEIPKSSIQDYNADKHPVQPNRSPLRDLPPTSVNLQKPENDITSQKQKNTPIPTLQPQKSTTSVDDDEYGSFSFTDEDLLSLGV